MTVECCGAIRPPRPARRGLPLVAVQIAHDYQLVRQKTEARRCIDACRSAPLVRTEGVLSDIQATRKRLDFSGGWLARTPAKARANTAKSEEAGQPECRRKCGELERSDSEAVVRLRQNEAAYIDGAMRGINLRPFLLCA